MQCYRARCYPRDAIMLALTSLQLDYFGDLGGLITVYEWGYKLLECDYKVDDHRRHINADSEV